MYFGAHAVLHGASAIACPLKQFRCTLEWSPNPQQQSVNFYHIEDKALKKKLQAFTHYCLSLANVRPSVFSGTLTLNNTIPISANLGSSAALCLNYSKLFADLTYIQKKDIANFAIACEHFFHGQSSGFDIHAINTPANHIILFHQQQYSIVQPLWKPALLLLDCKHRTNTQQAIDKVAYWQKQQWDGGKSIFRKMHDASLLAYRAMTQPNSPPSLRQKWFKKAMQEASTCYRHWGLIDHHLDQLIQKHLPTYDAITPIGAGGGGYLLLLEKETSNSPLTERETLSVLSG